MQEKGAGGGPGENQESERVERVEEKTGERTDEQLSKKLEGKSSEYIRGYNAGWRTGRRIADKGDVLSKEEIRDEFSALIPAAMRILKDSMDDKKEIKVPEGMTAKDVVANARSIVDKAVAKADKGEDAKGIGDDIRSDSEVLSNMRRILDTFEEAFSNKRNKKAVGDFGKQGEQKPATPVRETS